MHSIERNSGERPTRAVSSDVIGFKSWHGAGYPEQRRAGIGAEAAAGAARLCELCRQGVDQGGLADARLAEQQDGRNGVGAHILLILELYVL